MHFRECRIFGSLADASNRQRLTELDNIALQRRRAIPFGRTGHVCEIGSFVVFNDEKYNSDIRGHLQGGGGSYESRERQLVRDFVRPGDRIIEAGTAIEIVTMTAASIVGAESVVTFEGNPSMVVASRDNFDRNGFSKVRSNHGVLARRGLFSRDLKAEFHIAEDFLSSGLGSKNSKNILDIIQVPICCLEDEIARHSANVLICDIEGGEVDLLTGADLESIRLIIIETHYSAAGESETDKMMRYLFECGFSPHLGASGHHVYVLRRDYMNGGKN